jgi:TonB-linked SusC/RagA family outer membrane protein
MKNMFIKWAVFFTAALISLGVNAQKVKINGTVSDASGPIPGVSIREMGTSIGTITDVDGNYSIVVSPKSVLVFTYIGYKEQKIQVGNKTRLDVTMTDESKMLNELIVVGYGVQRKSDLATSVASVKADEMKTFPAGNVADMLRGRAAGVDVTSTSGRPGSVPSIKIRGTRSISADNSPLYIVDGSPSSATEFSTLNADDIESIEILKDAASQAIYGARASDGVILVTTKRGKEGKVEVDYNGYVGVQALWKNFDFYSPEEYVQLRREAKAHDKGIIDAREMSIGETLDDGIMEKVWASGKFIDWEKVMFRNPVYQNHDINIRGGSDKIKMAVGLNYFDQPGMVVIGSGYQKMSMRVNLDFTVNKWISFGINSSYAKSKQNREDGDFNSYITCSPLSEIYDEEGNYTKYIDSESHYNPLYKSQHYGRKVTRDNYRVNLFADIKPFKGFNYRLNTSLYNSTAEDGEYKDSSYPGGGSTASLDNTNTQNWLIENIFTYKVPFKNGKHQLTLTAVQSVDHNLTKSLGYSVANLPVDKDWNFISQGEFSGQPRREYNENNLVSFMARAQYSFLERYMLNVAVRRDGSSRFGKNNKWGTFPSVAVAWRANQEKFLEDVRWIDNLKVRLSYGVVGNQNGIGNYTTLGLADNNGYEFGDVFQSGYLPSKELSNPNLKWEQSATANIGLDFSFFKGRINGTLEYYNTHTKNLLVERTLNASLGYTRMLDNLGKTKSRGIDFSINGDVIRSKSFTWSLGSNFSMYKNEIVRIDDAVDANGKPASQVAQGWIIGQPINIYYDYKIDGIMQYEDFDITRDGTGNLVYTLKNTYDSDGDGVPDTPLNYGGAVEPGMVKVHDVNGDGKITADDRVPIKKEPNFTLSLSSTWKWKGFDLYMDWYGVSGRHIRNGYLYESNSGGSLSGKLNGVKVNYWTPFNPSNKFPRPSYNSSAAYQSSIAIQNASYIRLRTLQLGYTFSNNFLRKTPLHKLRLYATATNLLTFTEFKSYSPELTPGAYPESQQYVFGVNVSF